MQSSLSFQHRSKMAISIQTYRCDEVYTCMYVAMSPGGRVVWELLHGLRGVHGSSHLHHCLSHCLNHCLCEACHRYSSLCREGSRDQWLRTLIHHQPCHAQHTGSVHRTMHPHILTSSCPCVHYLPQPRPTGPSYRSLVCVAAGQEWALSAGEENALASTEDF